MNKIILLFKERLNISNMMNSNILFNQTITNNLEKKANIIKTFNKQSLDLISQMVKIIGDSELVNLKSKFSMIIRVNSTKPIKEFVTHIYKYKEKITNKNDSFFITNKDTIYNNKNINLVNNVLENKNTDENIDFVKSLKLDQVWNDLSEKSKNNIWDYFNILIILAEKYIEYKVTKHNIYEY